jgi:WASH complex subunit strumpellin
LDVIPESVFKVLGEIIQLQTDRLKAMPTKVERKYLKDFAQLEERYTLSRATHQVSVFTQGILAMNTTLMGIIKLDPRLLLEDGIRKQLVQQISLALHEWLDFRTGKQVDFEERLSRLGLRLDGFRQSFEYIQDYINIYGLKIWQEEFSRVIMYNVEQESNVFLRKKVFDWQSAYQSDAIPIPQLPPLPPMKGGLPSVNFMGRLVREVMYQTDPRKTTYVESLQGWYDEKQKEVVGIRTFSLLHRGVGIFGLTGMDKLTCFMIVRG